MLQSLGIGVRFFLRTGKPGNQLSFRLDSARLRRRRFVATLNGVGPPSKGGRPGFFLGSPLRDVISAVEVEHERECRVLR